jgi:polyferredoxin
LPGAASTSERACNTSASAAPRVSTDAIRSWTRWAIRGGLIRYSTENALLGKTSEKTTEFGKVTARLLRPRVIIYSTIVLRWTAAFARACTLRVPLKLNVLRDRVNPR